MKYYEELVAKIAIEVIRTNRMPDRTLTSRYPNWEILDANGQVTPHFIALQARQIAEEIIFHCVQTHTRDNLFEFVKHPS